MAYTVTNYATKKALKAAVAAGEQVRCFQPGGIGNVPENGTTWLEGPHYPQPHSWYAEATMKDGVVVRIK